VGETAGGQTLDVVKRLNIGTLGMDILLHTIALYFRPPFRVMFDTSLGGLSLQQASSTACPLLNLDSIVTVKFSKVVHVCNNHVNCSAGSLFLLGALTPY
jgi:hypothetical protein